MRENIPHYSEKDNCWKVKTKYGNESGSIYWCVSEFINNCLVYKFADGDHGHCFDDVLCKIIVQRVIFYKFPTLRHPELVSGSAQSTDAALRLRLVRTGSHKIFEILRSIYSL